MMQYLNLAAAFATTGFASWAFTSRVIWRAKARSLEVEAADIVQGLRQCGDNFKNILAEKDELIASLTAQRDKLSQDVSNLIGGHTQHRRNESLLRYWNMRNVRTPFQCVEDVLSAAYVHGPRGRLTRFVPKEPTVG